MFSARAAWCRGLVLLGLWITAGQAGAVGLFIVAIDGYEDEIALKAELNQLRENRRGLPIRVVRVHETERVDWSAHLKRLKPSEKVSHLFLISHAQTARGNAVIMPGLGGFGESGPFGPLADLLSTLSTDGRLGPTLHVYLTACGAFAGDRDRTLARALGLLRRIRELGVTTASAWGPVANLALARYRRLSEPKQTLESLRDPTISLSFGLGQGMLLLSGLGLVSWPFAALGGVFSAIAPAHVIVFNLRSRGLGTAGLLVEQSGSERRVTEVDLNVNSERAKYCRDHLDGESTKTASPSRTE